MFIKTSCIQNLLYSKARALIEIFVLTLIELVVEPAILANSIEARIIFFHQEINVLKKLIPTLSSVT